MPKNAQAIESPRNPQSLQKLGQKTSFKNQLIAVAAAPAEMRYGEEYSFRHLFKNSNLRVAMPMRAMLHNERKRNMRISPEIFNVFLYQVFSCSLSCK